MHILFVHGLRQSSGSWGLLNALIAQSVQADHSEFVYDARLFGFSSPDRAARSLITQLGTIDDDEIVIIGYSLGGLVARKAMQLILSKEVAAGNLPTKIKYIVTLGTPLSGARVQFGSRFSLNPSWIKFIQAQAGTSRIPYKRAIEVAGETRRPKYFHIQFESDEWVSDHDEDVYTSDDNNAGTLAGSHTGIASVERGEEIAQRVANVIRDAFAYTGGAYAQPAAGPQSEDDPEAYSAVILISCSNRKDTSPGRAFAPPRPGSWLANRTLQNELVSKRATIMDMLKAHKIIDRKFSQGNRGDRDQNVNLKRGPDFGVETDHAVYLPAVERYRGRLYLPLQGFDWDSFHSRSDRPLVLIMSALYGFVQSREHIQDYDAGLSDIDLTSSATLKDIWSDWMTSAINAFIERQGRKVKIFDLLADPDYTSAIRWSDLKRDHCSVFHLTSDKWHGIDLLTPAGIVARGLLENPTLLQDVDRTSTSERHIYDLSRFGEVAAEYTGARIAFERSIGDLPPDFNWSVTA